MSIYDRDYMNDMDESLYGAGGRRRYSAGAILIILNVAVWIIWQLAHSHDSLRVFMETNFLVSASGVLKHYYLQTLFTSAISHRDIAHILFNMLFFWLLVADIERSYGRRNFFSLYFFCGASAALAHVGLTAWQTQGDLRLATPALGASGAIMGLAVVAAIFNPNRSILFYGIFAMKLKWLVAFYLIFDLVGAFDRADHVAHVAHLGGALAGFLFWKLNLLFFAGSERSKINLWSRLKKIFRRQPALRIVESTAPKELMREPKRQRITANSAQPRHTVIDATISQRVDELLAKISLDGLDTLTEDERLFLNESSQKYKKR
ncbi:MAG: rhomboid family intramembrane serine protease [Planctomycetota bacterium]